LHSLHLAGLAGAQELKIDKRPCADNQLRGAAFEFARRLNKIGKPVDLSSRYPLVAGAGLYVSMARKLDEPSAPSFREIC